MSMRYRKTGVALDGALPGTVLSVEEALQIVLDEADYADGNTPEAFRRAVAALNAENTRREDAREAWEKAPVELHGVTLVPGNWYAVTEHQYSYGSKPAKERTYKYARYVQRSGYEFRADGKDRPDRVTYTFMRWPQTAARKVDRWQRPTKDGWIATGIVRLAETKPTAALLENVKGKEAR